MAIYYVNRNPQSNGDHEIHRNRCKHMPIEQNRILLGDFFTCFDALRLAKKIYPTVNACFYCSSECHTS